MCTLSRGPTQIIDFNSGWDYTAKREGKMNILDEKLIQIYIAVGIYALILVLIALPTLMRRKK